MLDHDYYQTYITELLTSFYLKLSLFSGGFGGVGPVTHLEAPGHGLVVHDSLGAELLALSVADFTEIFSIPEYVLCTVTHWTHRPCHLIWNYQINYFQNLEIFQESIKQNIFHNTNTQYLAPI